MTLVINWEIYEGISEKDKKNLKSEHIISESYYFFSVTHTLTYIDISVLILHILKIIILCLKHLLLIYYTKTLLVLYMNINTSNSPLGKHFPNFLNEEFEVTWY